ncbi:Hypothetical predicted protein, partial [Prunus dulcis]
RGDAKPSAGGLVVQTGRGLLEVRCTCTSWAKSYLGVRGMWHGSGARWAQWRAGLSELRKHATRTRLEVRNMGLER